MSDDITRQLAEVDAETAAQLQALHEHTVASYALGTEEILVAAARKRATLFARALAATTAWPAAGAAVPATPAPRLTRLKRPGGKPGSDGRRSSRDVILDILGRGTGPVSAMALAAAVTAEGLTRSAGDKVRRRLVSEGVVLALDGGCYGLAHASRGENHTSG